MNSFPPLTSHIPSPSNGSHGQFRVSWDTFVKAVLSVTVEAYQCMRADRIAQPTWEEDTFSINLRNYIRQHPQCLKLGWDVRRLQKVITPEMEAGKESVRNAVEIDIRIIPPWDKASCPVYYFAWEAKRIADRETNKGLIGLYVSEGIIDRFIDGKYSHELNTAGMLGYVLGGEIPKIVNGVNKSMLDRHRERPLSVADHLKPTQPIGEFVDIYRSCHKRTTEDKSNIHLYHLFLVFDWAVAPTQEPAARSRHDTLTDPC